MISDIRCEDTICKYLTYLIDFIISVVGYVSPLLFSSLPIYSTFDVKRLRDLLRLSTLLTPISRHQNENNNVLKNAMTRVRECVDAQRKSGMLSLLRDIPDDEI